MALSTPANDWIFVQLGGEGKVLQLSGWGAPFGRPRQKAVVEDGIEVRHATVYYPGNDDGPTRHLFGTKYHPWELSGRFMDSAGGPRFAQTQADAVKQFVKDQQEVSIRWSNIVEATGFIESFIPKREGPGDVAWTMTVLIDSDGKADARTAPVAPLSAPRYLVRRIEPQLGPITTDLESRNVLRGDIFDLFDNLVSSVTTAFAQFATIAEQIDSLERSALGTIKRFRASLHQFKTVSLQLRGTIERVYPDFGVSTRRATEDQTFADSRAAFSATLAGILADLADMDRQARLAQHGRTKAVYTARQGDTWESISTFFYGSANRAADIRDANGVASGESPQPGTPYLIPI